MSCSLLILIVALQRVRVYFFYESVNWLQYVLLIVFSLLSYTTVCYLMRLRAGGGEEVELDGRLPKPDLITIAAVAIADAVVRFATLRLTTIAFAGLNGGAIPLEQAPLVELCALPPFLLCSFIVVMLISKAMLPATIGQAMLVGIGKIMLQLVLGFVTFGLLVLYASS